MAEASIPVDLLNPGQVFACLGFLEAADLLLGDAEGGFDWSDSGSTRFLLRAVGDLNPVKAVLSFIEECSVSSVAPSGIELSTEGWNVPTQRSSPDVAFPIPLPTSPATLPARLDNGAADSPRVLTIDYWGDARNKTSRDNAKFWAGAGGYPGAALTRDALQLVRDRCVAAADAPFDLAVEQSSSFRFDWRRDYIPLDIGFSLNNHPSNRFSTVGYPLVEVLAAIGLTNARPALVSKLEYRYGVIGTTSSQRFFDPLFLRAALGDSKLPFPQRRFKMLLGWPGKEGQARCITTVTEELLR
ncbi:MAG: type I-U CRISPR-associated protein Cas8c [Pirellulaceae bacterium]|nr:type I-U CRISPR-associated protein Cas8c [Pirellulaceae bacterium]